jgi:NCS1 family nucleobase:cation symporter-1
VAPCLPGFIAAVNTSVIVPEGATELYYLNYLYGFLSSGLVYIVLHMVFPDASLNAFVKDSTSPQEAMVYYRRKWEYSDNSSHFDAEAPKFAYPDQTVTNTGRF